MKVDDDIKKTMIVTKENGYIKAVINRQNKKNAMNRMHLEYLSSVLENSLKDDSIKGFYITGEGDFFTSGNDFNNFVSASKDEMVNGFKSFIEYLMDYPKLLIAGVNGTCIGMGFTMLMHFDIVLCSESAIFLTPFIQTFQVPEGTSSYMFPKIFGKLAAHILYAGQPINSEEAKFSGLVTKVYDNDSFKANAEEYVESVCKNPLRLLTLYKKMMTKHDKEYLKKVNGEECVELRNSWEHKEFQDIIKKFVKAKF